MSLNNGDICHIQGRVCDELHNSVFKAYLCSGELSSLAALSCLHPKHELLGTIRIPSYFSRRFGLSDLQGFLRLLIGGPVCQHLQKSDDHDRIEMAVTLLGDISDGFLTPPGRAIRAVGCQGILDINDGKDAGG